MTLTRFLTDYVYVPIRMQLPFGVRRDGFVREAVAALATMLLCGLWHGAAWTFAAWGGAHGIALVANQSWRRARLPMPASVGWLLTFVFFAASMVLFRAADFSVAAGMLTAMGGWSITCVRPTSSERARLVDSGARLLRRRPACLNALTDFHVDPTPSRAGRRRLGGSPAKRGTE